MLSFKSIAVSALGAVLLLPAAFAAPATGKVFAKVGNWEVKRFPKYCVATVGFDGDRALRIHSGTDSFSFGFMGTGTATVGPKTSVTYWFDNNKQAKQTRVAVKRSSVAEDGGAPWLIFVDPPQELEPRRRFRTGPHPSPSPTKLTARPRPKPSS